MSVNVALNLPGGTIVAAIEELKKRGADHRLMRVVSINHNPETGSKKCNSFVLDLQVSISFSCLCPVIFFQ